MFTTTNRNRKIRALVLATLMVTSLFAGTVALTGLAASQELPPLSEAPAGTIFSQVQRGGNADDTERIGLIKRGNSENFLYNPSTDRTTLNEGDVLVVRGGAQRFLVTADSARTYAGSAGFAGPGATVFQGEQDTSAVGFNTETLVGVENGGAEGETLDLNQAIPRNQDTGIYSDTGARDGNTLTIQEPRVSRFEVLNQNGERIDAGGSIEEDEFVIVRADTNFLAAERAEIKLVDPASGGAITDGLLSIDEAREQFGDRPVFDEIEDDAGNELSDRSLGKEGDPDGLDRSLFNPNIAPADTIVLVQDLGEVEKAGDYEYEVISEDDEPFGDLDVRETTELTIASSDDPVLSFAAENRSIVQGEFAEYEIDRSTAGDYHVVALSADDLRTRPSGDTDVGEVTDVFREFNDGGFLSGVLVNTGDGELVAVLEDGRVFSNGEDVTDEFPELANGTVPGGDIEDVFTLVEIDSDGLGINQIDTGRLDDSSIDLNLYDGFPNPAEAVADYETNDGDDDTDEVTFSVAEATEGLAITSPGAAYVAGDDIDVEGTADPALDAVSVYARDDGDWELIEELDRVSVDADGTWDETDVTLSQVSDVLRVPGTYRIGVIDFEDADVDGDGQADATLETSDFSTGTSVQRGLRVTDQALDGQMVTYNGQVAVEDATINVSGVAPGADEVVVIFVGDRGGIVVNTDSVDDEDVFDNEDTDLADANGTLEEGTTRGFIISPARDGVFGGENERSPDAFASYVRGLEARGLTQAQAVELIRQASVDDDGSDDLLVETEFEITDADTVIDNVYAEGADGNASGIQPIALGETMVIEGTTNLRPDDNTIVLEMIRGPSAESFDVGIAEDWGTDGTWSATVPVPSDAEAGTYALRADDGETITTVNVEIVEQREEETTDEPTEETEEPTTTATAEPTTEEPTPTPEPTPEPTTTDTESPGFGIAVALVALIAAALLAMRRR
ncbi:major cell surface glycoprotein [Halogranum rubrum]|uniref:Cell surface glycoprotein n=1 Tax=Halogranum rubrum TaxID=553466 RepID=A0A1I4IKZ8_9EURY|nr:HVO_2072 family ArtA-dependent S-layer glycoprotein [Halogranum rubrum]SFL54945.1 major cell surface glycoprotein [Halogranum rubrum]